MLDNNSMADNNHFKCEDTCFHGSCLNGICYTDVFFSFLFYSSTSVIGLLITVVPILLLILVFLIIHIYRGYPYSSLNILDQPGVEMHLRNKDTPEDQQSSNNDDSKMEIHSEALSPSNTKIIEES